VINDEDGQGTVCIVEFFCIKKQRPISENHPYMGLI
jgi:hypothetical protein